MGFSLTALPLPPLFSETAPGAIRAKERLQHVRYQFYGLDGLPVELAVLDGIGVELFLERLREYDGDLHHFLLWQRTKLQISHSFTLPR